MGRNRLRLAKGALLVAGVLFLFGFRLTPRPPVTLRFGMFIDGYWGESNVAATEVVREAIDRFEAAHPGVRVTFESGILERDYAEWLAEGYLSGDEPDVFFVANEDFNMLSARGALMDLTGFMEDDPTFFQSAYFPAPLAAGTFGGTQYALPYEAVPTLMCVNETLLAERGLTLPGDGWTWSDFHAICRLVTRDADRDGVLDRFGVSGYTWEDAAYANGATVFNETGLENGLDANRMINSVNFLYALSRGNLVTDLAFSGGQVAFSPVSYADYARGSFAPPSGCQWTCVSMPAGPQGDNIARVDSLQIGISARTAQKELAWEFLKMLVSDEETQSQVAAQLGVVSPLRAVVASGTEADFLCDVMEKCVAAPKFEGYEEAARMVDRGISDVLKSEKDIRASLVILHREVNAYMNQ